METVLLNLLKAFLAGWFVAEFEPIHEWGKHLSTKVNKPWFTYITEHLQCHKCAIFWSGLIISHNFYIAVGAVLVFIAYDFLTVTLLRRWMR